MGLIDHHSARKIFCLCFLKLVTLAFLADQSGLFGRNFVICHLVNNLIFFCLFHSLQINEEKTNTKAFLILNEIILKLKVV